MSDLQAAPTAAANPPAQARAARLEKFQREQAIVEYLNRGVSVVEIAARVGVGEKRMRAIIREILARRMPGPPMEFVAIQMSRLNEALLVAYSAMSPTNLGAVDRVIKIVRELDRYRGFCAAERRRPEASSELEARAFDAAAGESAFAKLARQVAEDPDEDPDLADMDFAPDAFACESAEPAEAASKPAAAPSAERQGAERADSRPGNANPVIARSEATKQPMPPLRPTAWIASPSARNDDARRAQLGGYSRPGIPAQSLENIQSAPGFAPALDARPEPASEARPATEAAPRGFFASLAKDAFSSGTAAAHATLRDALIAAREEGAASGRLAPAGGERPGNPPQNLDNAQFAPGNFGWAAGAASGAAALKESVSQAERIITPTSPRAPGSPSQP